MAQGKKKANVYLETDVNLLEYIELLELYGAGVPVDVDASILQMTCIQFARLAEGAVEKYKNDLGNGNVGLYRERAQRFTENCILEEMYHRGYTNALREQSYSSYYYSDQLDRSNEHILLARKVAASQCAEILKDILRRQTVKGIKGRPKQAKNNNIQRLWDWQIIRDTIELLPYHKRENREEILANISGQVRLYVRNGHLAQLGDQSEQQCVDTHTKRIKRLFETVGTKSIRGFSIKSLE